MPLTDEQRAVLNDNRFCVVAYARKDGPPAVTPVYYVMDGDDILFSTTATRTKAKVLAKHAEVSVCVMAETHPSPKYVTVYGKARVEHEGAADLMMRIGQAMTGNPVPDAARPMVEKRATDEQRVVVRVTPERAIP